jgi:tetratricopeptide (TPR) repeat protein
MLKFLNYLSKNVRVISLVIFLSGMGAQLFSDGLPGEFIVTQRWRDLFAGHSPTTNPAFMTEENYVSIRGAMCPTLQRSFFLHEAGVIVPIGLYQSVGGTWLGLNPTEEIQTGIWDSTSGQIVPVGSTTENQSLFIFSYAINPWNRLSVGANVNIFYETNFGEPNQGFTFDLGLSYRFLRHALLGDHIVGMTLQNLLSPDFEFKNFQNYTVNLKLSWLAKLWEKRIDFGIDLDIKDFMSKGEDFAKTAISGGSPKQIEFDFNSRLGFWVLSMINAYFQVGSDYIGVSGGMNVPTVNNGRDFQVTYQYMNITDKEAITSTHTIYARVDVGKHREEIYARKMARLASIGPGNLYNKAMTLYSQGKYYDAFFIYGKILVEYPDFFKNDWVQLYFSVCEEKMDMREFASENFDKTKKNYPRSVVVPYADLGLLRLHYRNGNSEGVINQFARLNTATVPDTLKFHAYYYQGESYIRDGEYRKAIQLLNFIPESHPEYIFAQHSLAVAHALNDNLSLSIEALDNVIQMTPKTKAEQEVVNRSFVFLGYIFYEGLGGQKRALSKAVSALRKVPVTSYFYEDALLGLAWCGLTASQWTDCINACNALRTVSKKAVNHCEADLLEAYCNMVNKKYVEALNVLSRADKTLRDLAPPSENEKSAATLEYDNNRSIYYEIASEANGLALTSQSSFVIQKIDSLRVPQTQYEKELNDYYIFSEEFKRRSFFARSIDKIRDDVEYALAKAEKMAGQRAIDKTLEKAAKEAGEIDDEMKKLEEELKALEEQEKKEPEKESEEKKEE